MCLSTAAHSRQTVRRVALRHNTGSVPLTHVGARSVQRLPGPGSNGAPARHVAARAEAGASPKVPDVYVQDANPEVAAYQANQKNVPMPGPAELARTLLSLAKNGILTTVSTKSEAAGLPFGSVIEFVASEDGRPLFAASSLSPLTKDLLANPACCLTVLSNSYEGPQDARVSVSGNVRQLEGEEAAAAREAFLAKHPDSFWVQFGDFSWWRLDDVRLAWVVFGFGGGRKVTPEELAAAKPDPVAPFSGPVCEHMNADHADSTVAMVKHYLGLTVDSASMLRLDRLGVDVEVKRKGGTMKLRLPWVRPVEDRKAIKEVIVEMTRAAAAAQKEQQ